MHIGVKIMSDAEVLLQDIVKSIGQQMLKDELTAKLLKIQDKRSEEYKKVLDEVQAKIEALMGETLERNPELREALKRHFGADYAADRIWLLVANWWGHNNTATKLDNTQIWVVD
jgi:hypothetical protein